MAQCGRGNYFAQMRAAEKMMRRWHEQALAEGYTWDGMDGYYKDEEKK